jgi:excisionase family DNA binding protein
MPKNRTTAARTAIRRGAVTLPPGRAGFTPQEVADLLGISRVYVYELLKRGDLTGFHLGRAHRVTADSVAALIDRQIAAEGQSA